MFSKTEVVPSGPVATKHTDETIVSFNYDRPGILRHKTNSEDFSHGIESQLHARGYHLLPGAGDVLASWHNGSDFIVTIRGFAQTSVIYAGDLQQYRHFMQTWAPAASVWHLVAPFPRETTPDPTNYPKFNLRRGW